MHTPDIRTDIECWDDSCVSNNINTLCFWDGLFLLHCRNMAFCRGYFSFTPQGFCVRPSPPMAAITLKLYNIMFKEEFKCNRMCFPIACCHLCWMWPFLITYFAILILTFSFILVFIPPFFIFTLALPFMRAHELETFHFADRRILHLADMSEDGHVPDPCNNWKRGWMRCVVLSCLLCLLGWIPAIIFNIAIVVHWVRKVREHGWE
jgi:hypothetical protein